MSVPRIDARLAVANEMARNTIAFRGTIKIRGINPYVLVSAIRARTLRPDWRKPMPVLLRVNGEPAKAPWRINMMPTGTGAFYLYLHGDVRRASGTEVGDRVTVELTFDTKYRNGPMQRMPAPLRRALAAEPKAKAAWGALIPSRKKEILRYLLYLKSDEARTRNIARVLHSLSGKGVSSVTVKRTSN